LPLYRQSQILARQGIEIGREVLADYRPKSEPPRQGLAAPTGRTTMPPKDQAMALSL
jgi:hypothetical protein